MAHMQSGESLIFGNGHIASPDSLNSRRASISTRNAADIPFNPIIVLRVTALRISSYHQRIQAVMVSACQLTCSPARIPTYCPNAWHGSHLLTLNNLDIFSPTAPC